MIGTELLNQYRLELNIAERQREVNIERGENVSKLRNRCKSYRNIVANLEKTEEVINSLKPHTYYSMNISRGDSSAHNVIMYVGYDVEWVTIFNASYEEKSKFCCITGFHHLEVLRELTEMKLSGL